MRVLKWLMPRDDAFNVMFERHAEEVRLASVALRRAVEGDSSGLDEVVAREDAADAVTRDVLLAVRKSFITPFDRGAIKDLITAMDDSVDEMNKTVSAIRLFGVERYDDGMRAMAERIERASGIVARTLPLLREMGTNANEVIELCGQVKAIEGEADDIHREGLQRLWNERHGRPWKDPDVPTMDEVGSMSGGLERFVVGERVLGSLEKVMDRLEDVADVVHGIVIEHV